MAVYSLLLCIILLFPLSCRLPLVHSQPAIIDDDTRKKILQGSKGQLGVYMY
jgi:hypothetical protein